MAIYRNSPNQSSCQSFIWRNIVELKKTGSSQLRTGPIMGTYIGPCFLDFTIRSIDQELQSRKSQAMLHKMSE